MSEEKNNLEENIVVESVVDENEVQAESICSEKTEETAKESAKEVNNTYIDGTVPPRRLFGPRKEDLNFLRDKWILSRINDEDLLEYLKLEQKRSEQQQQVKEIREKRILSAFQLSVSLAAAVAVIYFLKDDPTILLSIQYICAMIVGLWIWKKPRDK